VLRETLEGRRDVLVFFEVPDVLRILREGAFWDVYYEHCSYFTPGSLARLFRRLSFTIEELYVDYGRQYVMLAARPADAPATARLPVEKDRDRIGAAVRRFGAEVAKASAAWRRFLFSGARRGRRTVLWGSGSKAVAFLTALGVTNEVECVVDVNPYRHGKFMPGVPQRIIAPERLVDYDPDYVVVMNPIYTREVRQRLDRLGLKPLLLTTA